jgi:hypothetical protein
MSEPTTITTTTKRLAPDDYKSWDEYWTKEQNQPWRTEPEIDEERQRYLAERRAIQPDIEKGIYPIKGHQTRPCGCRVAVGDAREPRPGWASLVGRGKGQARGRAARRIGLAGS